MEKESGALAVWLEVGRYVPATGTPEANGLTLRETFPMIRRLCAESNVP